MRFAEAGGGVVKISKHAVLPSEAMGFLFNGREMVPVGIESGGALAVVVLYDSLLAVADLLVHEFEGAALVESVLLVIDDVVGASALVFDGLDSYGAGHPRVVLRAVFIVFGRSHHLVVHLLERPLLGGGLKRHVVRRVARESFMLNAQLLPL